MATTPKQLVNTELPTSIGIQYTVPASKTTRVREILLCNGSGAARTVTIHFVESGDSPDEGANAFCRQYDLEPGIPYPIPMNTYKETGDSIRAFASGVDVTMIVSGIERDN